MVRREFLSLKNNCEQQREGGGLYIGVDGQE